jgi:hypothetical protein
VYENYGQIVRELLKYSNPGPTVDAVNRRSLRTALMIAARLAIELHRVLQVASGLAGGFTGRQPVTLAGRRRLSHATALDAGLLPFKLRPIIHHTSCLHRGRPRPRQHANWLRHHCVTTTSSCCRSLPRLGLVKGVIVSTAGCLGDPRIPFMMAYQTRPELFYPCVTIAGRTCD